MRGMINDACDMRRTLDERESTRTQLADGAYLVGVGKAEKSEGFRLKLRLAEVADQLQEFRYRRETAETAEMQRKGWGPSVPGWSHVPITEIFAPCSCPKRCISGRTRRTAARSSESP